MQRYGARGLFAAVIWVTFVGLLVSGSGDERTRDIAASHGGSLAAVLGHVGWFAQAWSLHDWWTKYLAGPFWETGADSWKVQESLMILRGQGEVRVKNLIRVCFICVTAATAIWKPVLMKTMKHALRCKDVSFTKVSSLQAERKSMQWTTNWMKCFLFCQLLMSWNNKEKRCKHCL